MFNSRIVSNNCNIIKCSLLDDLMSYDIIDDRMIFSDGTSSPLISKFDSLSQLIELDNSTDLEVWRPIFLDHDNYVDTKMLSSYGSYRNGNSQLTSGRLGIENFFKFSPTLKSWDLDPYTANMGIDWILNKSNSYFSIYYGLLGWYRYIDSNNSRSIGGSASTIDTFPDGSRLIHDSKPDKILIKITDDLLYSIDDPSRFIDNNGNWGFQDESNSSQILVSSLGDQPKFSLANGYYNDEGKLININQLAVNSKTIHLWIPDGDFFAYFNSENDQKRCFANNISSYSYVSPSLYNTYSNIYRIITLDEPRSFNAVNLRKSRAYKKLAHALSTSPFITDFCINMLDHIDIRKIVQNYISSQNSITNIDQEMVLLKDALVSISQILQNTIVTNNNLVTTNNKSLFLDTKSQNSNLNNNFICNNKQLFQKLINKYGAQLIIDSTCEIKSKNNILKFNNNGIVITQVTDSYVGKTVKNKTIYNNQTISFDDTVVKTNNSLTTNTLDIYSGGQLSTSVPLVDFAKPRYGSNSIFNIKLEDQGYVEGDYRVDGFYFSPDGDYDTYIYQTVVDNGLETIMASGLANGYKVTHGHSTLLAQEGILLTALEIDPELIGVGEFGVLDPYSFLESEIGIVWEQISGPEGHFGSDNDLSLSGISNTTIFYTGYTGKFVVQCTISTPFGSFKKQKTFYVVDGKELILRPLDPPIPNDISFGKYWDPDRGWILPPGPPNPNSFEAIPLTLNIDQLKVQTSKVNSIAINNLARVVWPIKTSMKVREDVGNNSGSTRLHKIFDLSGNYKFKYSAANYKFKDNTTVTIRYEAAETTVKVHSIFLEKIRTNEEGCESCLSFYEPIISSYKAVQYLNNSPDPNGPSTPINVNKLTRNHKYPASFSLISYKWTNNQPIFEETISFDYPNISTEFAPPIKSYGGYSKELVSDLGVTIPKHPFPQSSQDDVGLVSAHSPVLPVVSGYKIDYTHDVSPDLIKMCYQKALVPTLSSGSVMTFTKGVLHPNSGWLPYYAEGYKIHANRCGLLKFNPGARDSFSFIGPMLSSLKNNSIDIDNNIITNTIYSSTINLNMAREVQWEPDCSCGKETGEEKEKLGIQRYNANQTHKEYSDISYNISNHGYRNLGGGTPKQAETTIMRNTSLVNDEFLVDQNNTDNSITYSFVVTGPSIIPEEVVSGDKIKLRNPRVNNFGIKDIEVKLNFLNYVNTKNLVVWLEVGLDTAQYHERYRLTESEPRTPVLKSPIRVGSSRNSLQFIEQQFGSRMMGKGWDFDTSHLIPNNDDLSRYLYNLIDMNSNIFRLEGEPFKLVLLNQEHIQNNGYNFSVKFSDHAPKHNSLYDTNLLDTNINIDSLSNSDLKESVFLNNYDLASVYQDVIHPNDSVQPTVAATGFSDRESCIYRSIIKNNKLNITNNTFNKLATSSLFLGFAPVTGPCEGFGPMQKGPGLDGNTTFTLKMMILDENDDMNPHDTLNHQYKPGFDDANNKITSNMIFNSLCNWELILHVGPVNKPVPYTQPNLMSYGSVDNLSLINYDTDPQYPGYSFISDLSKYKHLLPLANYNAPHSCIVDSTVCLGKNTRDITGGNSIIKASDFPTYAIIQILSSIAQTAISSGGTLGSLLSGLDNILSPGYNTIVNWFAEVSYTRALEDAGRQIYAPSYNKYPFGSPEKILINFRKANSLWYTAEVPILKYHNTPILKPNQYKFIRLRRGQNKYISEFSFSVVEDHLTFIDNKYIKSIECTTDEQQAVLASSTPTHINNVLINNGDIISFNNSELYIPYYDSASNTQQWHQLTSDNMDKLTTATTFLKHNIIIGGGKPFFDSSFSSYIDDKKIILLSSRVPYDIFAINDTIECYDTAERTDIAPPSLQSVKIINKALLFKNNQYYTAFILDTSVTNQNTIAPTTDSHIFFVYDNLTSVENKIQKKYNIWGLDKNKKSVNNSTPSISPTVHSAGSYGDLSPFLNKNILSNNIQYNQLLTYADIFNNKINDKLKYNKLTIIDNDGKAIPLQHESCYGFAYSEKDINLQLFDTKNNAHYITPEFLRPDGDSTNIFNILKTQINSSTTNENELTHRYGYIRANIPSSDKNLSQNIITGNLLIENDFVEYIPIKNITEEEKNLLEERLNEIDDINNTSVEQLIGDVEKTTLLLQSSNLPSIIKHYNLLSNDPSACYRPDNPDKTICYKQQTEQKINDLYLERQEILDLLDSQTVRSISLTYNLNDRWVSVTGELISENDSTFVIKSLIPDSSNSSSGSGSKNYILITIPKQDVSTENPITRSFTLRSSLPPDDPRHIDNNVLSKYAPNINQNTVNKVISITYDKINADHYWINLDPKQSTFKDFEKNPKILIDTTYFCDLANPLRSRTLVAIKNNVCPFHRDGSQLPETDDNGTTEEFFKQKDTRTFVYSISETVINQQKQKYEAEYSCILGWKIFTKQRFFNINGDQTFDISPNTEITVTANERYWIPITKENKLETEKNDHSADANPVNGISACQTTKGSPGGFGLIARNGQRLAEPTRIYNIVNLDDVDEIYVSVKRIPRMLRGVDLLSTVYRYGIKNLYRQVSATVPMIPNEIDSVGQQGSINNSLYYWTCFQKNLVTKDLQPIDTPPFFQLQNEMIFRAFFGSVDKIENKTDMMNSYYPWELIPYEYAPDPQS